MTTESGVEVCNINQTEYPGEYAFLAKAKTLNLVQTT